MTTVSTRLRDLEQRHAAVDAAEAARQADIDGEVAWLAKPSIVAIMHEFAERLAQRRWLLEHDCDRQGWWMLSRVERRQLGRDEGPPPGIDTDGLRPAIAAWLGEPDALGWPAPRHLKSDYAAFTIRLAAYRQMLDSRRSADDDAGRLYRERRPAWLPGMTPAQHDRLDLKFPPVMFGPELNEEVAEPAS